MARKKTVQEEEAPKGQRVVDNPPTALVGLVDALLKAEQRVEELDEQLKAAGKVAEAAEKKLLDEMVTQQINSFRTPNLGGFRSEVVVYPNVKDKEGLNEYVKKEKLDWLFTVSIHGGKLKSWVKELMSQGKDLPPMIDPFVTSKIRRFK